MTPNPSCGWPPPKPTDRKSTRLNSSHVAISYAVFCLKKKKTPSLNAFYKEDIFQGVAKRTVRDESVIEAANTCTKATSIEYVAMHAVTSIEEQVVIIN